MPPSKRKPARRKATEDAAQGSSDVDLLDSSPSKPSTKKRKANGTRSMRSQRLSPPEPIPDLTQPELKDDSDVESDTVSQTDLIDSIISYLSASKDPVRVAHEHANKDAGTEKVKAYAKIAGKDWTYYVHDQIVNIGRPPDDRQIPPMPTAASSPIHDLREQFPVHIDLGPSKIVSRHHASISYDADHPDGGGWHVRVNGRNGVRVNNNLLRKSEKQQLHSGDILDIAGTQMMFVLPNERVQIHQDFIDRAKALANGEDVAGDSDRDLVPEQRHEIEEKLTNPPGYQSLAPAPPNLPRLSTPPLLESKGQRGVFDSKTAMSPMYGRGMMLESTQEIDYSRDAAKDLKPPYSYAHMIAQAIFSSDEEKLTLSNIYSFIAEKYAFYRHSNSGWQNSIRHNLSLNKAFQKVPRRTDEPGKGMKWQIAPEQRQEYLKKMQRRSGGSSNPSSPASAKEINPNFRGPNGQNLGYDTSMVTQFSAKDTNSGGQRPLGLNMSFPPYLAPGQPQPHDHVGALAPASQPAPHSASTPQRSRTNTSNTLPDGGLEDSPLPRQYGGHQSGSNVPFYSMPNSAGAPTQHSPSNPMLSSSYLDTPFHHSQHSIITPAPLRQNPRLAPPSTLVAPSKFMPESSPAGPGLLWKGFLSGMTPGPPGSALPPDMSPVKTGSPGRGRNNGLGLGLEDHRRLMSSSPPPMDGAFSGSPSKPARGRAGTMGAASIKKEDPNSSFHSHPATHFRSSSIGPSSAAEAPRRSTGAGHTLGESSGNSRLTLAPAPAPTSGMGAGTGAGSGPGPAALNMSRNTLPVNPEPKDEDDEDGDGFDLARGFAPIGGYPGQRSSGVRG